MEYANVWFQEISSSKRFYSLAACHGDEIIGLIVAELKNNSQLNKEVIIKLNKIVMSTRIRISEIPLPWTAFVGCAKQAQTESL